MLRTIGLLFLLAAIPAAQAQTTYINPNGGGYTAYTPGGLFEPFGSGSTTYINPN